MTPKPPVTCGWCRDPYCTGGHSGDEVADFEPTPTAGKDKTP